MQEEPLLNGNIDPDILKQLEHAEESKKKTKKLYAPIRREKDSYSHKILIKKIRDSIEDGFGHTAITVVMENCAEKFLSSLNLGGGGMDLTSENPPKRKKKYVPIRFKKDYWGGRMKLIDQIGEANLSIGKDTMPLLMKEVESKFKINVASFMMDMRDGGSSKKKTKKLYKPIRGEKRFFEKLNDIDRKIDSEGKEGIAGIFMGEFAKILEVISEGQEDEEEEITEKRSKQRRDPNKKYRRIYAPIRKSLHFRDEYGYFTPIENSNPEELIPCFMNVFVKEDLKNKFKKQLEEKHVIIESKNYEMSGGLAEKKTGLKKKKYFPLRHKNNNSKGSILGNKSISFTITLLDDLNGDKTVTKKRKAYHPLRHKNTLFRGGILKEKTKGFFSVLLDDLNGEKTVTKKRKAYYPLRHKNMMLKGGILKEKTYYFSNMLLDGLNEELNLDNNMDRYASPERARSKMKDSYKKEDETKSMSSDKKKKEKKKKDKKKKDKKDKKKKKHKKDKKKKKKKHYEEEDSDYVESKEEEEELHNSSKFIPNDSNVIEKLKEGTSEYEEQKEQTKGKKLRVIKKGIQRRSHSL